MVLFARLEPVVGDWVPLAGNFCLPSSGYMRRQLLIPLNLFSDVMNLALGFFPGGEGRFERLLEAN